MTPTTWRRLLRDTRAVIGLVVIGIMVVVAIGAPVIARHDPLAIDLRDRLSAPSAEHWMGTDMQGRDVWARLVHGARVSLAVGLISQSVALAIGLTLGLLAGFYGRWVDEIVMRLADVTLAFPTLLLLIAMVAALEPSLTVVFVTVGVVGWAGMARLVRGQVLVVRQLEYVQAIRSLGGSDLRVMWRHVFPNVMAPVVIAATLGIAGAIMAEAALSFLGLGVPPPAPSWGSMIADARDLNQLRTAPWTSLFPGLAIGAAVLGFNLLGDALRDVLDPRFSAAGTSVFPSAARRRGADGRRGQSDARICSPGVAHSHSTPAMTTQPAGARTAIGSRHAGTASGYDVGALREREFPWAARGDANYLNNASTGPLPRRTVDALADFNERRAAPYLITDEVQFGTLRRSRELCARLINARPDDIALMVNTTYGINLAARALPLESGDIVLTNDREFPANIYPWMALASRGVVLERVPCVDGLPDEEALIRAIDRPRVKVVTTSWVSFATGYRVDLARIGAACRERGIYFVVDAIQGLGALTLDVADTPVDILCCGAQKWLTSSWGTAFTYVRPGLVRQLEPQAVGWMATRASENFGSLVDYDLTYLPDARRFEVITLPFQEFSGLNASLELFFELGPATIAAHVAELTGRIVNWANAQAGIALVTPADARRRAGIVTLRPRDTAAAAERLAQAGIVCAIREGGIRLSPHYYNTRDEVDAALEVLESV